MIEYFFKNGNLSRLVKPSWYEARSFALSFLSFQSGLTSLCFVDDLCQILGDIFLNIIGCSSKCGPAGILENATDRCIWKPTCSNLHTERFSGYLTARWRASAWSDKMNKEQSAWWSLRGSDSCKNMLISTISELPWCCNYVYRT